MTGPSPADPAGDSLAGSDGSRGRFPREARIRKTAEYRAMARGARRFHTHDFVFQYRPGSGPGGRVGITVSRRVGNAVVRNRIKRWVREVVRTSRGSLSTGWDLVVIARPVAATCAHADVVDQLGTVLDYLERRGRRR